MKVIVIGCTHAGTAATIQIAKRHPDAEITVYERNDNISFLSCGIALHVGGVVRNAEELFYAHPDNLSELGVNTRMRHEVLAVDTERRTVTVRNLETGETLQDTYDKLVMTTGSWPVVPKLPGMELDHVMLCKNYAHAQAIIEKAALAERIAVVGAGYIGVELAEAFRQLNKRVTLFDNTPRVMYKYLDQAFTDIVEADMVEHGIELALGQTVQELRGKDGKVTGVVTTAGEYDADLVIMCIGFRPNTGLLQDQVKMLPNGAIIVDEYMRTSSPDVYAAGDSCAVRFNPTGEAAYIPLATNAVRMGTLVAMNLKEPRVTYKGTQGTSGIRIFDLNVASTGLTEQAAKDAGLAVRSTVVTDNDRPEFMPTYEQALLKLVYEAESGRLVGAQVLSKADLTQSVNTLSVCIQNRMTVEELGFVDFFFQPHYNKPWNLLNQAGLQAQADLEAWAARGGLNKIGWSAAADTA
ncbi:NADPH-dependent 2,4-dienoyl-CoA reductase, sulfur reductase [Paenibacillus sp. UNCCL117]|uniref:FAD-dependent oxidoreductase n=1 Tax=unclassified Paenibacillus TaxID=185978 RepID=UPI000888D919|nr:MULTISPECIES: FAD-dependent oxidoreductase [unclassified Paenibacillus]SDD75972.1 NADPH-dependent 2,4-dienoyl-CoA reductase, sulfur reductase [Paenibacillus sp. cl123]SFW52318.1 NADPH-dependent 2,4-dienoyl-CoA reductase, sulfur reductase [Paenibacillus sp. UNCCL117]